MRGGFSGWGRVAGLAVAALVAVVASGCGDRRPDLTASVGDAKGVGIESQVVWNGAEVGRVVAVRPEGGRLALDIELGPAYRGQLRQGLVAKPMNGVFTGFTPVLELYGGDDPAAPALERGALIGEATVLQAARHGPYLTWAGIGGGLLLVGMVLRGAKRFVAFLLAAAFLAASLWVLTRQWQRHGAELIGPETNARLSEFANDTLRSPEAAEAWRAIRGDVGDLAAEARERGRGLATSAWPLMDATLQAQVERLESAGNAGAAGELKALRERIGSWLGSAETPKDETP